MIRRVKATWSRWAAPISKGWMLVAGLLVLPALAFVWWLLASAVASVGGALRDSATVAGAQAVGSVVQALAALATLVVTGVLAWFNWKFIVLTNKTLEQSREQFKDSTRPVLVFNLLPSGDQPVPTIGQHDLIIRNAGLGPAIDVTTDWGTPWRPEATSDDTALQHFTLGPGEQSRFHFTVSDYSDSAQPPRRTNRLGIFRALYRDTYGRTFHTKVVVYSPHQNVDPPLGSPLQFIETEYELLSSDPPPRRQTT
jgi:hypothetical protein